MKIAYASDMHGDMEFLNIFRDYARSRNDLEVIISSGDLLGQTFNEEEIEALEISENVLFNVRIQNQINRKLYDLAKDIAQKLDLDEKLRTIAKTYLDLTAKLRQDSGKQYEAIKQVFDSFEKPVLTIPGNWDTVNMDDYLSKENLHEKHKTEINNVSFAGYGASPELMSGIIPREMELPFSEKQLYGFLKEQDPDIAIIHAPPYGFTDGVINKENKKVHMGNLGALSYLLDESPNVVLTGHRHGVEIVKKNNTVIINPGNLGRYNGNAPGTFAEFELDSQNYLTNASFYQIIDPKKGKDGIEKIAAFENTEKGLVEAEK
jgi:Icc-related predicted phosphoesterase